MKFENSRIPEHTHISSLNPYKFILGVVWASNLNEACQIAIENDMTGERALDMYTEFALDSQAARQRAAKKRLQERRKRKRG